MIKRNISTLLFAVACWCLLIQKFGYRFGSEDHAEHLPYILYLADQSLYAKDFFIQNLHAKIPNERTVFCNLLLPFVNHLALACFVLHFLTTVFLIAGLEKLGTLLTGNRWLVRMAILINFLLLFDKGLGNVELITDAVQGSSISVVFLAWALYYFFKQNWITATVLAAIGSIFHPLDGLVVYSVMAALMLYLALTNNEWKKAIAAYTVYAATAGGFIVMLMLGKIDGVNALSTSFDAKTFYSIYHEFRLSHHFVFSYFPAIDKLLFVAFALINLLWWPLGRKQVFLFCLFGTSMLLVYMLIANGLKIPDIANLQFYKITQWTKFFAVLAVCKLAAPALYKVYEPKNKYNLYVGILLLAVVLAVTLSNKSWMHREKIAYEYGCEWQNNNDLLNICKTIDEQVPKDALFVQPLLCSEIKYWGRTSSFVDWKAFVKNRSKVAEWYRRINLVYGISLQDPEKGFALSTKADEYFEHMSHTTALELKHEGVTHLLSKNKNLPFAKLLFSNTTYAVYQL